MTVKWWSRLSSINATFLVATTKWPLISHTVVSEVNFEQQFPFYDIFDSQIFLEIRRAKKKIYEWQKELHTKNTMQETLFVSKLGLNRLHHNSRRSPRYKHRKLADLCLFCGIYSGKRRWNPQKTLKKRHWSLFWPQSPPSYIFYYFPVFEEHPKSRWTVQCVLWNFMEKYSYSLVPFPLIDTTVKWRLASQIGRNMHWVHCTQFTAVNFHCSIDCLLKQSFLRWMGGKWVNSGKKTSKAKGFNTKESANILLFVPLYIYIYIYTYFSTNSYTQ